MYEYFGVGPEIQEEVNNIFPRFFCWLPKHHLFMPFRHSLEIWRLVIYNLIANDVSPFPPSLFFIFYFFESLVLGYGLVFSHFGFHCDFLDIFKSLGWI